MMTLALSCAQFEAQLSDYLDPDGLDARMRSRMDAHRDHCASCQALVSELQAVMQEAAALPLRSPSRDLWPGIAAQLETRVLSLPTARVVAPAHRAGPRTIRIEWFAAAAAALVLATAGATWRIARARDPEPVRVASAPASSAPASPASTPSVSSVAAAPSSADPISAAVVAPAPRTAATEPSVRPTVTAVSRVERFDEDAALSREIASLREVVQTRYAELDSGTVAVIKRNLAIIDGAIADSRKALRKDPRNRFLADQLDRALTRKIELMRQAALLERGS
jgi:hypothetical protein